MIEAELTQENMLSSEDIKKLKALAVEDIEAALGDLEARLSHDTSAYNALLLLKKRRGAWKSKQMKGVISHDDSTLEENNISNDLLELIDTLAIKQTPVSNIAYANAFNANLNFSKGKTAIGCSVMFSLAFLVFLGVRYYMNDQAEYRYAESVRIISKFNGLDMAYTSSSLVSTGIRSKYDTMLYLVNRFSGKAGNDTYPISSIEILIKEADKDGLKELEKQLDKQLNDIYPFLKNLELCSKAICITAENQRYLHN